MGEENKGYIVYEYITKEVSLKDEAMYKDCIETFGWEQVSKQKGFSTSIIGFRRDRNITSRSELRVLENKLEFELKQIAALNKKKTEKGTIISLILGIIGTLIMGGGMSLVMLNETNIRAVIIGVVIGSIGILIASFAYPIFKKMVFIQTKKVSSQIEEKYDKISNMLIDANRLVTSQ